ncbi:competence type IV pilus minor pilin ComGD [Pseudalkalibacillus caeni]|uniref:Type II secretion system protein n=1 Tax=Exobacillus caeni TaxID=2574798 RepID=A0A5R9F695_9BACL|nr:competence type IV pilus minor pilin ComGD [Pseudalkalibacillus caeni]TLS36343.1 type II secretion system protein [Pseudalkalibacillus caeni]
MMKQTARSLRINRFHDASGYTLIELIITLAVLSVLIGITIINVAPVEKTANMEQFLDQLKKDIRFTQQLAIKNGQAARLVISTENHWYSVQLGVDELVARRKYPPEIAINPGTLGYAIKYLANGNVQKSGTLTVNSGAKSYKLVILLGSGRFYVQEL